MEENRIPKRVLYMNLGTTRLRGRPRNRWQDEVREEGRMVSGEGWQENECHFVENKTEIMRRVLKIQRIFFSPKYIKSISRRVIFMCTIISELISTYTEIVHSKTYDPGVPKRSL